MEVKVLEAAGKVGGALSTRSEPGLLMEEGADSFIRTKPRAIDLCERLGLGDSLIPTRPSNARTLIVRDGRLLPVPEGVFLFVPSSLWSLARSPLFSTAGKLRMGLDLVLPRGGPAEGRDESIGTFIRRRLGREALERLVEPMVAGIWGGDPDATSLLATMPRMAEIEREHRSLILAHRFGRAGRVGRAGGSGGPGRPGEAGGAHGTVRSGRPESSSGPQPAGSSSSGAGRPSGARYGLFVTLRDGMQSLPDALAAALPTGTVRTGAAVSSLQRTRADRAPGGARGPGAEKDVPYAWQIVTSGGERMSADAVIVALPAGASARLLRPVDEPLAVDLEAIPCLSAATLNLAFRASDFPNSVNGFGFVCPAVERRSVLACTFTSRKYEGRSDPDRVLIRAYLGGHRGQELIAGSDAPLVRTVLDDLRELMGLAAAPLVSHLRRYPEVFPVYHPGHLDRVRRLRERAHGTPGLALAGNALDGVGVSDCVGAAEAAVDDVRRYIAALSG